MTTSKRISIIIGAGIFLTLALLELPHTNHFRQTTLVERLDVPAMSQRADVVITGTVTKQLGTVRETDLSGEDMVYTRWRIVPDKQLKGIIKGQIVVRTLGGRYLTTIVDVEDQPSFSVDEHVAVFLQQVPDWKGDFRVVGEFQGKFGLESRNGKITAIQSGTKEEQSADQLESTIREFIQ